MQNASESRSDSEAIRLLKVRMAERGMRPRHLAELINRQPRTVSNLLTGNNVSWPMREAVNEEFQEEIFPKPTGAQKPNVQTAATDYEKT